MAGTWGWGGSITKFYPLAPASEAAEGDITLKQQDIGVVDCWDWEDCMGQSFVPHQRTDILSVIGGLGDLDVGFTSVHQVSIQCDLIPLCNFPSKSLGSLSFELVFASRRRC